MAFRQLSVYLFWFKSCGQDFKSFKNRFTFKVTGKQCTCYCTNVSMNNYMQGWKFAVVCSPETTKFTNGRMDLRLKSPVWRIILIGNSENNSELSEEEGVFERIYRDIWNWNWIGITMSLYHYILYITRILNIFTSLKLCKHKCIKLAPKF